MRWILLLTTLLLTSGLSANPEAQAVVMQASNKLMQELQASTGDSLSSAQVEKLVDESVTRHVDFVAFSRSVLGKHWRRSTQEQHAKFIAQFKQLVVRSYSAALKDTNVTDIVFPTPKGSAKVGRAVVPTVVKFADSPEVKVDYRMYLKDGHWVIYDVLIEDISMAINYRSEFTQIINHDGFPGLIRSLEKQNRQTAAAF